MQAATEQAQRRALEELYVLHERGLYNVAYRYVWNADDARDVVQDAFVRLWRKRDDLDWPRAAGLAYRVVLGLAANRRRGNAVRRLVGWSVTEADEVAADVGSAERGGAHDVLSAARTDAAVRRAIDRLPAKLRDALLLCTFGDLDYAAVGEILGVPAGTVGSRRTEALARIRAEMEAT